MKKDFDCVEMKRKIQEELQQEVDLLGKEEARNRQWQRVLNDPILGPFVRNNPPRPHGWWRNGSSENSD
jgi:hypothetical protein